MRRKVKAGGIAAALATVAMILSACAGFHPMYAQESANTPLRRTQVITPKTRGGYMLRESLEDTMAYDNSQEALYTLTVTTKDKRTPIGTQVNGTATRYELRTEVAYVLVDRATGKDIAKGNLPSISITYVAANQPYSGVSAQLDSDQRAADKIAGELVFVLTDALKRKSEEKPAAPAKP